MTTPGRQYKRGRPTLLTKLVGHAIRTRRLRLNMRQSDFAAAVGTTKNRLSDIELNQRSHLTIAALEPLASRLGVPVSQLLRDAEAMRCELHEPWEHRPPRARSSAEIRFARAVGRALRQRRQDSGRKLVDIARDAGIDCAHFCEHERGDVTPSLTNLFVYAQALGCAVSDLLRDAEEILASKRRRAA